MADDPLSIKHSGFLGPLLILAGCFHLVVAAILLWSGLPHCLWPVMEGSYLAAVVGLGVLPAPLAIFGALLVGDMAQQMRGKAPISLRIRSAYLLKLCCWCLLFILIFCAAQVAYVNLKVAVPILNDRNCDPQLEAFERFCFGGILPSAWFIARCSAVQLAFWDAVYELFNLFLFSSLAVALHTRGVRGGARLTLVLVIGLYFDGILTLLYPTVGPIFEHPEWFAALEEMPSWRLAEFLKLSVEQYAQNPGHVYALAGISAMPSYHVYAWTAGLMCWRPLPGWLFAAGVVLTVLNWVSTVVLGWHYALDGLAGTVLALLAWWGVGKAMSRLQRNGQMTKSAS